MQHSAYLAFIEQLDALINIDINIDEKTGALELKSLKIEGEAYDAWAKVHDAIEANLGPDGKYSDIKAMGSKAAENVARLAAIFCFVEKCSYISVEHIERSGRVINWYLTCASLRLREATNNTEQLEAKALLEWIIAQGGHINAKSFKSLPSKYRSARVARSRLELLVKMGYLKVTELNRNQEPSNWQVLSG